jgi:hypothetical protein
MPHPECTERLMVFLESEIKKRDEIDNKIRNVYQELTQTYIICTSLICVYHAVLASLINWKE